ncbi:MAG: hypothetical protein MPW14_24535 [Candidatus Manganitrophus sp.]|nr:MAG: hypothetical protein MPW14_24535 [Candidatus Manganitrophus sp.]
MIRHLVQVASALVCAKEESGKVIHLDIEPEPDGLIENSIEAVDFFRKYLLPIGAPLLSVALQRPVPRAERDLLEHIRLCYDTSHMAVEYEEAESALDLLQKAGIQIGKVQISAALEMAVPSDPEPLKGLSDRLRPFRSRSTFTRSSSAMQEGLHHYADLSDLFPITRSLDSREWRIHFHLPSFSPGRDRSTPHGAKPLVSSNSLTSGGSPLISRSRPTPGTSSPPV